jgi:hypothetical protein
MNLKMEACEFPSPETEVTYKKKRCERNRYEYY